MPRTPNAFRAQREPRSGSLSDAIHAGDLARCTDLLGAGADPNGKDDPGYPPLTRAAGLGLTDMVKMLLTAGADPSLLDTGMGSSALHKAAQGGSVEVAMLLVEHGAFLGLQSPTHGHASLIDAVWYKRESMTE